jgi:Fe2+ or Zn2+ uptake regulation protein
MINSVDQRRGCRRARSSREADDVSGQDRQPERPWGPNEVRDVLRSRGLRYSRPRRVILGYLSERDRHVSAENLYVALKQRGEDLSLSTVYLNLGVLAEAGLVRAFSGANGEVLYDSNPSEHYHVISPDTGEVIDVMPPVIDGQPLGEFLRTYVEAQTGWEIDEPHVTLRGRAPGGVRSRGPRDGDRSDAG